MDLLPLKPEPEPQADALTDDDLNQLYQEMLKENPSLSSSLQNAQTTTSAFTGLFLSNDSTRKEFINLVQTKLH